MVYILEQLVFHKQKAENFKLQLLKKLVLVLEKQVAQKLVLQHLQQPIFFAGESTIEGTTAASLELETEVTQETTNSQTAIVGDTKEVRWERTITVPSGSSSLVYDAIQTYNNVIFPNVKRLRLRASQIDPSDNTFIGAMTGNEIATQLRMSNFNGIITLVGSDFIEISVEGQTVLNNFVEGYNTIENGNHNQNNATKCLKTS